MNNEVTQQDANELIDNGLTDEQRRKARELAEEIDASEQQALIHFGTDAQSRMSDFSHSMVDHIRKKDTGQIGNVLKDLMQKLDNVNPDELSTRKKNALARMFSKVSGSINEVLSKYQKVGAEIDKISVKLERQKGTLLSDIENLEQLFNENKEYFDTLNLYIEAGEIKLEDIRNKELPALREKADQSNNQMVVQELNDLTQFADRLEKRVHDLKLSRTITIQTAPQIRMIQNMNHALAEKIQSSILTAIPLWKNQMAIALTLFRQRKAVEAQKQVSQTTNDLLLKNAEMLKENSIETAKENERGLIDIDTLKKTQQNLVSTVEETLAIQNEGRTKRQQAEQELVKIEDELKELLR